MGQGTLYGGVWWPRIQESYTGAWQDGVTVDGPQTLLMFSAVWSCVTGISGDVAKLRPKQIRLEQGVWDEVTTGSPFLPVLRRPNDYQGAIEFLEQWILSKLLSGNTYVLLERDNRGGESRGIPRAMYVLDPCKVKVLLAPDGAVYYELSAVPLNGIYENVIVPASEIIHDRCTPLWHPLVGVSPLYACAISATMGNKIQSDSTSFFGNRSLPGGMLTAPGRISQETADRMKEKFETNFSGLNIGRLLVGGDGLKFEATRMAAEQSQLAEQLQWTVSDVARAFHYPEWKLGGDFPPYAGGPQASTTDYYTSCLQILIEKAEAGLDYAFGFGPSEGVELDIENLLRMDTVALVDSIDKATRSGVMAPNEGRRKLNLPPVRGGDSPYLQQQNYSLEALAKRDASPDPFASKTPAPTPEPNPSPAPAKALDFEDVEFLEAEMRKELIPA